MVILLCNIFSQSETGLYNLKQYVNVGHSRFDFYLAEARMLRMDSKHYNSVVSSLILITMCQYYVENSD